VVDDLSDPNVTGGLRTQLERSLARTARVLGPYIGDPPA
jgi:hypothetical protein